MLLPIALVAPEGDERGRLANRPAGVDHGHGLQLRLGKGRGVPNTDGEIRNFVDDGVFPNLNCTFGAGTEQK